MAAGDNIYTYAPNMWGWIDPLGLCKGKATIRHSFPEPENRFGHYSVEVKHGNNTLHTEQVITSYDYSTTTIDKVNQIYSEAPVKEITIDLPNAKGAMEYQRSMINKELGPYSEKTNSCVEHVCNVLRAGGVDVPNSALGQFKFLKGLGF
jgi:hypothetical protein